MSIRLRDWTCRGDGKHAQAARILDAALERNRSTAGPTELLEALADRAELAARADDPDAARRFLTEAAQIPLADSQRVDVADSLAALDHLTVAL